MGDEFAVVPVFFAGVVFQALLVSRSMPIAAWTAALAGASLSVAWWMTRNETDQLFSLPFFATGIFVLVFALFFREHLLPRVSPALLLHYTLIGVYALYVAYAGAPVSIWVLGVVAVPTLLAIYLGVSPRPAGRFLKLVAYVWFLSLLTVLIGLQLSLDDLKILFEAEGFSLSLYSYIFVSGMVFLFFASNLLYLLLLIPISDRNVFWDSVLGSGADAAREHRDVLAAKMSSQKISTLALASLTAHGLVLAANYRWEIVASGLLMNFAVVAIAFLSTAAWPTDEDGNAPPRMVASDVGHGGSPASHV